MAAPKTAEDWWALADSRWAELMESVALSGADLNAPLGDQIPGGGVDEERRPLAAQMEVARRRRDHNFVLGVLNLAWASAPDNPGIHRWPAWGALCDLCSESWVFDE